MVGVPPPRGRFDSVLFLESPPRNDRPGTYGGSVGSRSLAPLLRRPRPLLDRQRQAHFRGELCGPLRPIELDRCTAINLRTASPRSLDGRRQFVRVVGPPHVLDSAQAHCVLLHRQVRGRHYIEFPLRRISQPAPICERLPATRPAWRERW